MVENQEAEGDDAQPVEVGAAGIWGGVGNGEAPERYIPLLPAKPLLLWRFVTTGGPLGTTSRSSGTIGRRAGVQLRTGTTASKRWR